MDLSGHFTSSDYFYPPSSPHFQSPQSVISYSSDNSCSPTGHENYSLIQLQTCSPFDQFAMNSNVSNPASTATFSHVYDECSPAYYSDCRYTYIGSDNTYFNRDEGIGSSPSSLESISPPIACSEFQTFEYTAPSLSNFHELPRFSNEGEFVLMENLPNDPLLFSVPNRQCVRCGSSSSSNDIWFPDSTGHILCQFCQSQPLPVVPRCSPPVPEVKTVQKPASSKQRKRQPGSTKKQDQICSNCGTDSTPLWRRNRAGQTVCNACGLYQILKNMARPVSMRKDVIQRRKRKSNKGEASQKKTKTEAKNSVPNTTLPSMPQTSSFAGYENSGLIGSPFAGPSTAAENLPVLPPLNISIDCSLYTSNASTTPIMHS